jgi:hypothetical protein
MTDLRARIEAARKAGYSDAEIQSRLNDVPEIKRAREAGYDDAAIYSRLGLSAAPQVTGEVGFLEDLRKSPAVAKLANVAERIAPSPEEVTAGIGEAIANIPESAVENILAAGGTAYDLVDLAISADPERYKKAAAKVGGAVAAIPGALYGAVTSPVETIEQTAAFARKNPVGAAALLSGVTGGAAALMPTGRKLLSVGSPQYLYGLEFGAPELAAISRATNPLAMPGALAQGAYNVGREFISPVFTQAGAERAASNKLLEAVMGRPQDVTAALRTEPPSLMGGVPAAERLAAAGQYEPVLGTMQADLSTAMTQGGREALIARQQRLAGIQQQIAAIDEQLKVQGRAMSPEAQAQLDEVRNSLLREQAAARAALAPREQAVGSKIPAVGQKAPGEAIAARAAELRTNFQKKIVRPAYELAFRLAGKNKVDVSGVLDEAERILGRPISFMDVSTEPQVARQLAKIERKPIPGEFVPLGDYGGYSLEPAGGYAPTKIDLRTADAMRKAINNEIGAISDSAPDAGIKRNNLMALHKKLDAAVMESDIPDAAKSKYKEALGIYRGPYMERFRTGITSDILRTTKKNQSGILPSKTVEGFLANEDAAAQFAATFGNDPIARQALTQGILDLAHSPKSGIVETSGVVRPEKIDDFITKYRRQFAAIGIDAEKLLAPVRQEAEMLRAGRAELDREAVFFRTSTSEALRKGSDFVDVMLKDPAAMQAGLRRLSNAGRSALTKEVVDRGIRLLNDRKPEEVLNYLEKNKRSIRMVLDQPYFDRLKDLAENQRALMEVEKRAQKPAISGLTVDISKVPQDKLMDLRLLANEIQRMEDAERMMKLRPAEDVTKAGAPEIETAKRGISGFLSRELTTIEKILDIVGGAINRKTAAVLTDALTKNPAKAADLIEQAIARQNKPAAPPTPPSLRRAGITGALAAPNMMAPENQNAMAR